MERMISPNLMNNEAFAEKSLRPRSLEYFTGQMEICSNLRVFIDAAIARNEALDHALLSGPPGLGKTTMAQIIAYEMNGSFRITSGPILTKPGDLAAILTNMTEKDVLFIDEIHRMNPAVEEMLYPAMEDFKIDIIIGEGQTARTLRIDIPPFTIIGATTRLGLLSQPLRERFGIPLRFEFYTKEELASIISRNAELLGMQIENEAAYEIAIRSRGTPRIAYRLLRRIRDFANVGGKVIITHQLATISLDQLKVDPVGLDSEDKKYLEVIRDLFGGGPVGLETIAAALCESKNTIEDVIEPYLIQIGFIQKTPRGRILTPRASSHSPGP
ncbi:MAG: Holliday junction branch migration DNA helicase RuvB [Holosporales bacterium]|jgi:Holliday junction DNA helicase RuvB|nr:Holliday junction branch migration DNA helicase RuvB [Holosporales bacterium]